MVRTKMIGSLDTPFLIRFLIHLNLQNDSVILYEVYPFIDTFKRSLIISQVFLNFQTYTLRLPPSLDSY